MNALLRSLFWIGIVMLFLPFFGIPDGIKVIIAIALGVCIILLTFSIRNVYKDTRLKLRRLEQPVVDQSIHTHE